MAYSIIALENLTELKNRRGNSTNTTMATLMGLNYPIDEAFSVWAWDNLSTATPDDIEIVQPLIGGIPTGRWFKVDLDQIPQVNTDWNSTSGVTQLLNKPNLSTVAISNNYLDLDNQPFIPNNTNQLTNGAGYITASSTNILTNKSGSISQWTNDIGYLTTINSSLVTSALGYTPYNGTINSNGYISTETDPTVPSWAKTPSKPTYTASEVGAYPSTGNPSGFLTSVPAQSWSSITGKPSTLSGYGITDAYPLTGNPSGFLTSVTSTQVTSALGFTPYNATNPSGYITGINSGNVITALGYTPINPNGTNSQYIAGDGSKINFPSIPTNTNQLTNGANFINQSGARTAISLTTVGSSGNATYDNTTGVLNIPNYTQSSKTFNNNVSRNLNSNFTISTTRDALVTYSISLSVTNPLLAGSSSANAFLEYSTDGGVNWIIVSNITNSSSVALAVTIALTQPNTFILNGSVPANALVRIRTTTSGTASATFVRAQEVLY